MVYIVSRQGVCIYLGMWISNSWNILLSLAFTFFANCIEVRTSSVNWKKSSETEKSSSLSLRVFLFNVPFYLTTSVMISSIVFCENLLPAFYIRLKTDSISRRFFLSIIFFMAHEIFGSKSGTRFPTASSFSVPDLMLSFSKANDTWFFKDFDNILFNQSSNKLLKTTGNE